MRTLGEDALPPSSELRLYWLGALSWTCWLVVFATVGLFALHKIQRHTEDLNLGHSTGQIRYALCKRFSSTPRPTWQECAARTRAAQANLLAPATVGFLPPDPAPSSAAVRRTVGRWP